VTIAIVTPAGVENNLGVSLGELHRVLPAVLRLSDGPIRQQDGQEDNLGPGLTCWKSPARVASAVGSVELGSSSVAGRRSKTHINYGRRAGSSATRQPASGLGQQSMELAAAAFQCLSLDPAQAAGGAQVSFGLEVQAVADNALGR